MLSDRLRGKARLRVEQNLTETCTIERPQSGQDEYGGAMDLPPVSTTSACHLSRMSRNSADMVAMADQGRVYYMLHLPWDADIEDGDEVVMYDGGRELRYRVEQALRQQSVQVMRQAVVVLAGS